MGPCYTCRRTVAFGGIKAHGFRFCSKPCYAQKAELIDALGGVPAPAIDAEAANIKNGSCARCGKRGNVEFHKSVFVWSAIFITRLSERTFIGCKNCATKSQALSTAGTLLVGWWGVPFGLIFTPVALLSNCYQIVHSRVREKTSHALRDYARERLAFANKFGAPDFALARGDGRIEPRF